LRDALRSVGGQVEWHEIPGGEHDWADTPPAALDETGPSFGALAADFFERTL
jgi:acetyl esterase/lipase